MIVITYVGDALGLGGTSLIAFELVVDAASG